MNNRFRALLLISIQTLVVLQSFGGTQIPAQREAAGRFRPAGLQIGAPWPKYHNNPQNAGIGSGGGSTGVPKWLFYTKGIVASSPAIAGDGSLYFGSFDNKLYAVNRDGSQKWSFSTGNVIWSSPAIAKDGTIYFGSEDNSFYALNPNGTKKWAFATGGPISSSPTVSGDGTVYFGSWDNSLYALTSSGTKKWSYTTGNLIGSSPAIGADGTIYVGASDANLYAINPNGSLKWKFKAGNSITSSPSVASDGTIYVGSSDHNLYAFNPDGSGKWIFTTGSTIVSSPAIGSDGTIYVGSNDFNLYAVTPNGELKWNFPTGLAISSAPAIGSDGTLYFGSADGFVYALAGDGSVRWKASTKGAVVSSPSIDSDGTVYIGSNDQSVYAFGTEVNTVPVTSLTINPGSVPGGNTSVGTVNLSTAAPSSGDVVSLLSGDASVTVPNFVVVPGGATTAQFTISTSNVSSNKTVVITARSGNVNATASLLVTTGPLKSLVLSPSSVVVGLTSFGTVTLSSPAGSGGVSVGLLSSNPNASVPSSVVVAEGNSSATFTIHTSQVSASSSATITATVLGISKTANLSLIPVSLQGVTIDPASTTGGTISTGTVTLTGPAGTSGATVKLSCDSKFVTVPVSVVIGSGATTTTFKVTNSMVTTPVTATISASYSGATQTATETVNPLQVVAVSIAPGSLLGGASATATVSISGPAPTGGLKVLLTSTNKAAPVPATLVILAGKISTAFAIKTIPVASNVLATVTAKFGTVSQSATLSVQSPSLTGISLNPTTVTGGTSSFGTVAISAPAPTSGMTIKLSSSSQVATLPASIAIPSGKTFTTFTVKTMGVSSQANVQLSASLNGTVQSVTLTVNPPLITGLSLNPKTVKGGTAAVGTVTISGPAPTGGFVVKTSVSSTAGSVPSSVTIPVGKTSTTFKVTTAKVPSNTIVVVSASQGLVTKSASLTINH